MYVRYVRTAWFLHLELCVYTSTIIDRKKKKRFAIVEYSDGRLGPNHGIALQRSSFAIRITGDYFFFSEQSTVNRICNCKKVIIVMT